MSRIFQRCYAFQAERPSAIKKLVHPIGQTDRPSINSNSGVDTRSFQQRKQDFMDLEKNRERREELKKEFAKSSFQAIYDFRDTGGKFFTSPSTAWGSTVAKYMPNFCGHTLDKRETGTVEFLGKETTIIRIFSSTVSYNQISSYTEGLDFEKAQVDLLDINIPTSWLNKKLVQWASKSIKKKLLGPFHNYILCRKGITPSLRESIWAGNELGGYLYVVDKQGKIRWAASGRASENERKTLNSVLNEIGQ